MADVRETGTALAQGISFTFLTGRALSAPVATEHEALRFVSPRQMLGLSFCPADVGAVRWLNMADTRHFLWDFDGTLMDTYSVLTRMMADTCRRLGHEEDPAQLLSLLKHSLPYTMGVMAECYGISLDEFRSAYPEKETEADLLAVQPIPGIPQVLKALTERGAKHYIVTHRSRATCELMLRQHGLLAYFTGMVTAEDPLPRKPDPARCLRILESYGLAPGEAVMIGDRPLDVNAGRAAGLMTLLLDTEGRFPDCPADFTVSDIRQMLTMA